MLEEEERIVRPLARCEEKRKKRAKHWQCDTEEQDLEDTPTPEVQRDLSTETRSETVEFLEKVEQCGDGRSKLAQRCAFGSQRMSRAAHCAVACQDSLVGRVAGASGDDMAAVASCRVGRYPPAEWRRIAHGVGDVG